MISVNLIPDDRLIRNRRRRRLRTWTASCAVYVLALTGVLTFGYLVWGGDDVALANELQATAQKARESSLSIEMLRRELAEAQAALEASKAMGNQPDWCALLVLLAQELGDDVVLDGCELSPLGVKQSGGAGAAGSSELSAKDVPLGRRRYELKLSGFGRTQTAVSHFVLRLERIELFDEVRLTKSNRQPFLTGEAVAFRIECTI